MGSRYEIHIGPQGSGGSGPPPTVDDHFAPKYLVGNVPAGDPNAAQAAPFVYIPDPGDGSGIAAALAQPNGPGDVWIRPGTYDLGAGTTPPLFVPTGVRVQGSGQSTIVKGKTTGDQGVFVLSLGSTLSHLQCEVTASDAGSVTSIALIRSISALLIEDVQVTFATAAGGVLRQGIRLEATAGAPKQTNVRNVNIVCTTTPTGIGSPTACMWVDGTPPTQAYGDLDTVFCQGGDVGVINNGLFIGDNIVLLNWYQYGIWTQPGSGGALSQILNGYVIANPAPSANPIGVYVQAGGLAARSVSLQLGATAGGVGVAIDGASGQVNFGTIENCTISCDTIGVKLGSSGGLAVNGTTVRDCEIVTGQYGVLGGNLSTSHITDNDITLNSGGSQSPVAGIQLVSGGTRDTVEDNAIQVNDGAGAAYAIDSAAAEVTISGNAIIGTGAGGIHVHGQRHTCVGNVIQANAIGTPWTAIRVEAGAGCTVVGNSCSNSNAYTLAPIVMAADLCTIGNNITSVTSGAPGATPGISISGSNNTCLGNTCNGSNTVPVSDTGLGNDVAHNIGV